MPDTHVIFIDESGIGSICNSKINFWVTVGVQSSLKNHINISYELHSVKKSVMRLYNKELKGTDISKNHLNPGITKNDVAEKISELIEKYHLCVIVTACNMSPQIMHQTNYTPSNPKRGLQAKDISRGLLLERFSLKQKYDDIKDTSLLIWDLSDNNELMDFSTIVGTYTNPHDNRKVDCGIIPHLLGGLSHEWAELQIADLISNYALNYVADGLFSDVDKEKSNAFKEHILPKLHSHNGKIDEVGLRKLIL